MVEKFPELGWGFLFESILPPATTHTRTHVFLRRRALTSFLCLLLKLLVAGAQLLPALSAAVASGPQN